MPNSESAKVPVIRRSFGTRFVTPLHIVPAKFFAAARFFARIPFDIPRLNPRLGVSPALSFLKPKPVQFHTVPCGGRSASALPLLTAIRTISHQFKISLARFNLNQSFPLEPSTRHFQECSSKHIQPSALPSQLPLSGDLRFGGNHSCALGGSY